jgi:hypothetical protein
MSGEGIQYTSQKKTRPKRKIKTDVDDFDKCVIRRTIKEFHTTEGERPLKPLLAVLKKKFNFRGGKRALWKIKIYSSGGGNRKATEKF